MTELNQIAEEAMEDSGLEPQVFDAGFRQREGQIRNSLARYHGQEYALRREIKANVDLSPEARQDLYRVRHQAILDNFYREADAWTENHLQSRLAAYRQLHAADGSEFSDHIMRASSMDDQTLERTYRTAKRSGALELARALAQAAYDRGFGPVRHIFEDWAQSDPVRADALKMLHTTPGQERTYTRIHVAMKPPTVSDPLLLRPSYEDHKRAEEKKRQEERERRGFFDASTRPRRRGRRSS